MFFLFRLKLMHRKEVISSASYRSVNIGIVIVSAGYRAEKLPKTIM
jgi:hypothetical protein